MNATVLGGTSPSSADAASGPDGPGPDLHITDLRRRLDEIDERLIELWQERAAISHEVGVTRVASGGTRLSLAREQEILNRYREALGEDGIQLAMLVLRAGRGRLI
jgi:chorismate mutase